MVCEYSVQISKLLGVFKTCLSINHVRSEPLLKFAVVSNMFFSIHLFYFAFLDYWYTNSCRPLLGHPGLQQSCGKLTCQYCWSFSPNKYRYLVPERTCTEQIYLLSSKSEHIHLIKNSQELNVVNQLKYFKFSCVHIIGWSKLVSIAIAQYVNDDCCSTDSLI